MIKKIERNLIPYLVFLALLPIGVVSHFAFAQDEKKDSKEPSWPRVEYTAISLRDPFMSPDEMIIRPTQETKDDFPKIKVPLTHLHIQGMVWGSKSPQAIINNKVVRKGDVIEGAQVLDVRKEGVYLLYQDNQYILRPETIE
ncbi:MAG: hypothetical protein JW869_01265 [Candidatus Omnitrophica bacterium]|nr:hypothetical protein [Candidatus Omnitrophota bacterium]